MLKIQQEQEMVAKLKQLIDPAYLYESDLILNENKGDFDTVRIRINDCNPWRNGSIKGDLLFCRIKIGSKTKYINLKKKYSSIIADVGLAYTSTKSESDNDFIRITLTDFFQLLNTPSEQFKKIINQIYLDSISFPAFGCCSKMNECRKADKCLHADQLYATACQYQKLMKRTGKFE